jgi:hypothetical protein
MGEGLLRHAFNIGERQCLAGGSRKLLQKGARAAAEHLLYFITLLVLYFEVDRKRVMRSVLAIIINDSILRDAIYPGWEAVDRAQGMQTGMDLKKDVLHNILNGIRIGNPPLHKLC